MAHLASAGHGVSAHRSVKPPLLDKQKVLQHLLCTDSFPYHFPLGAEEGVTLQSLVVLALDDVGEHFVVHLVRRAIGYSEKHKNHNTDVHTLKTLKTEGSHRTSSALNP